MPTYVVAAHTDPPMLARLVDDLRPSPVIVHVDRKAPLAPFREALDRIDSGHVSWLEPRVRVGWAAYSSVAATLGLLRAAVEITADDDYVCFLTGQDVALWPAERIAEYLHASGGRQFIAGFDVADDTAWPVFGRYVGRRHFMDWTLPVNLRGPLAKRQRDALTRLGHTLALPNTRLLPGVRVLHGHANWAITGRVARGVLDVAPRLEPAFRHMFAPDEKFFHTAVDQVTGGANLIPYAGRGQQRYTNLHYVNATWTTLTEADWSDVRASGRPFARKLDSTASAALLHLIDQAVS